MPDPEALAREDIDRQLELAGWIVQDREEMNLFAGAGVAIRQVSIRGAGEADYLLVANQRAIGIIEDLQTALDEISLIFADMAKVE